MAPIIPLAIVYFIVGAIGLWAGSQTETVTIPYSGECTKLDQECTVSFTLDSTLTAPVYVKPQKSEVNPWIGLL